MQSIQSRSLMGAWIETGMILPCCQIQPSRSLMGAWIETACALAVSAEALCRSLMGAWIETISSDRCSKSQVSLPYGSVD